MRKTVLLTLCSIALTGCGQLGLETPAQVAATKEAEGRAVGSACRHSGRSLEDCYTLNKKASKAAIFSGWRDMDAYMRENNIEIVPSTEPPPKPPAAATPDGEAAQEGAAAKPAGGQGSTDVMPKPAAGGKMV